MPARSQFSERISGRITPEMRTILDNLKKRKRLSENQMFREALHCYIDQQGDVIGSRTHFTKTFNRRIDRLEDTLSFQLNIIINILAKGLVLLITWLSQKEVKIEATQLIRDGVTDATKNYRSLGQYIDKARPTRSEPEEEQVEAEETEHG